MKYSFYFLLLLVGFSCKSQKLSDAEKTKNQEKIIDEHLKNGAWKYGIYSQEWQQEIDKGLAKDSTIAYLWQQKAMPLFKQGKYELGMKYIDKAVTYNAERWQPYRAFIKCIFAKTYQAAIDDFEDCKTRDGNAYVMDHTYNFYIALSYLQLNEFKKAEQIITQDIATLKTEEGETWVHHLDLFYLGIAQMEQQKYEEAISSFDWALQKYSEFSDVQFYKSLCLRKIGKDKEAEELLAKAKENAANKYSITEDNVLYERYPYQVRW